MATLGLIGANRHIFRQGKVLAALAGSALDVGMRRAGWRLPQPLVLPGPEQVARVPAPCAALVRDYLRHLGGDAAAHRGRVPAHLFPHWVLPVAAATLRGLPFDLVRVVNAGCRLRMHAPLRLGETFTVRARLVAAEDDGRRVRLTQHIVTGTSGHPTALEVELYTQVPSAAPAPARSRCPAPVAASSRPDRPRVPQGAREIAFWRLAGDAGWVFATLTGDFNPVHWIRPYARAAGWRGTILHGFATLARAMEGLGRARFGGDQEELFEVDVRFTKPLVLPARVGLFLEQDGFFVGEGPGGPAYLVGTFSTRAAFRAYGAAFALEGTSA